MVAVTSKDISAFLTSRRARIAPAQAGLPAYGTNRRVAAHSMTPTGHSIALAAGVDSIEHGDVIDEPTAKLMAQKKVYLSPTLTVGAFVEAARSKTNPIWTALGKASEESFKRALAAGVPIALGTDAGGFPWDQINQA